MDDFVLMHVQRYMCKDIEEWTELCVCACIGMCVDVITDGGSFFDACT